MNARKTIAILMILVALVAAMSVAPVAATVSGDKDDDGLITLSEVTDLINLWENGEADLSDVIQAINVWSKPPIFRAEEKFVDWEYVPDNGVIKINDSYIEWTFSWDKKPVIGQWFAAIDFEVRPPADLISWKGETVFTNDLPNPSNDIEQPSGCELDDQGNPEFGRCPLPGDKLNPDINDISIKCGDASKIEANHVYQIRIPTTISLGDKKSVPIEVELKDWWHKPIEADTFDVEIGGSYEVAYGVWGDLDKLGEDWSYLDDFDQTTAQVTHI